MFCQTGQLQWEQPQRTLWAAALRIGMPIRSLTDMTESVVAFHYVSSSAMYSLALMVPLKVKLLITRVLKKKIEVVSCHQLSIEPSYLVTEHFWNISHLLTLSCQCSEYTTRSCNVDDPILWQRLIMRNPFPYLQYVGSKDSRGEFHFIFLTRVLHYRKDKLMSHSVRSYIAAIWLIQKQSSAQSWKLYAKAASPGI